MVVSLIPVGELITQLTGAPMEGGYVDSYIYVILGTF